jgi:hypothetical protein
MEERMKKARYAPVMKFEREGDRYAVFRMTYLRLSTTYRSKTPDRVRCQATGVA